MVLTAQFLGRWLIIGCVAGIAAGCAGNSSWAGTPSTAHATDAPVQGPLEPQSVSSAQTANGPSPVEQKLRSAVRQWEGTPHRLGGTNRRGIDCSGFVQRLYRDIFTLRIPRSTALQVKSGRSVGRNALRTGDLVFFRIPGKKAHVGIYLGRAEFAHASTSNGVMTSSLRERFWHRCYWTARRYLNAPE
jgi:cell wall-associated NlpC family hydrolase